MMVVRNNNEFQLQGEYSLPPDKVQVPGDVSDSVIESLKSDVESLPPKKSYGKKQKAEAKAEPEKEEKKKSKKKKDKTSKKKKKKHSSE